MGTGIGLFFILRKWYLDHWDWVWVMARTESPIQKEASFSVIDSERVTLKEM